MSTKTFTLIKPLRYSDLAFRILNIMSGRICAPSLLGIRGVY